MSPSDWTFLILTERPLSMAELGCEPRLADRLSVLSSYLESTKKKGDSSR